MDSNTIIRVRDFPQFEGHWITDQKTIRETLESIDVINELHDAAVDWDNLPGALMVVTSGQSRGEVWGIESVIPYLDSIAVSYGWVDLGEAE